MMASHSAGAGRVNFDAINAAVLASYPAALQGWFPGGKVVGKEYEIGDLAGSPGKSLKVNIKTGKWSDFAGEARGGDPVSLFAAAFTNNDQIAAAKALQAQLGIEPEGVNGRPRVNGRANGAAGVNGTSAAASTPPASEWQPTVPPPADAPPPSAATLAGWRHVYVYRDAAGAVLRYVVRNDKTDSAPKQIFPLTYGVLRDHRNPAPVAGWHMRHAAAPRHLYGLDLLATRPTDPVIIAEGEKAADAVRALMDGAVGITWSAGTNAAQLTDWAPLAGRRCIIWPDADEPGQKCAALLTKLLTEAGARDVQTLDVAGMPDKWDAADALAEGWTPEQTAEWVHARLRSPGVTPAAPPPEPPPTTDTQPPVDADAFGGPVPLGFDRGTYFYLSRETRQVEALTPAEHTEANLSHMASTAYYWERTRFCGKKGVRWAEAADFLRSRCKEVGIFDPDRVRGRGAWLDHGRPVLHLGDRVVIDGEPRKIDEIETGFIYEQSIPLHMELGEPLKTAETKKLLDLFDLIPWSQSDMGLLLAGWVTIAPVCGALAWRPHLWLTGEQGSGKTWVMDSIVKPLIGPIALEVQSKTSEAGIRQKLCSDARPVLFDESETQNQRDRDRVQQILDLARQASSEDGAPILKGSQSGVATAFRIRSCFGFCSINLGLQQAADESRTIVLEIIGGKPVSEADRQHRAERFEQLRAAVAETISPEFAGRLLARTLQLLPAIRANADTFARAAAEKFGSRRLGDTLGSALAGVYSLHSAKVLTLDQAREFIATRKWIETAAKRAETIPDHERCLARVMEQVVSIRLDNGRTIEKSIAEMVDLMQREHDQSIRDSLHRTGIKSDKGMVWFAQSHSVLERIFSDSPWATSWPTTLLRLGGAMKSPAPIRFGAAIKRAVGVPISEVFKEIQ